MNPIIQEYTVDLASNNNFLFVSAIQGDGHSTRYVDVTILDNQRVYEIDAAEVAPVIRGIKPDTTHIFNECEIVGDNVVRFEITTQMTAVTGIGNYEITLYSRTKNSALTSFPFNIVVKKSSIDPNTITSSNEFTYLQNAIVKAEAVDKEFRANEVARQEAEEQRALNENTRLLAEEIRISSEQTRVANEDERIASETERKTSEQERKDNEVTRQNNETERQSNEQTRENNEDERIANENTRKSNETTRISNEQQRQSEHAQQIIDFNTTKSAMEDATADTVQVVADMNAAKDDCIEKTQLTQSATTECNQLVQTITDKLNRGDFNGKDGTVMEISNNNYVFQVINDNLYVIFQDGTVVPDFEIVDGNLMINYNV